MVPMSAVHYPMDVTFRMYVRRMTQCQNSEVMMPRILMPGEASCSPEALWFRVAKSGTASKPGRVSVKKRWIDVMKAGLNQYRIIELVVQAKDLKGLQPARLQMQCEDVLGEDAGSQGARGEGKSERQPVREDAGVAEARPKRERLWGASSNVGIANW